MISELGHGGVWFVTLPNGSRKEFESNAAAWRWLDRQERRPSWCRSEAQFRVEPYYAVPSTL